jgi:hypothetical protein
VLPGRWSEEIAANTFSPSHKISIARAPQRRAAGNTASVGSANLRELSGNLAEA